VQEICGARKYDSRGPVKDSAQLERTNLAGRACPATVPVKIPAKSLLVRLSPGRNGAWAICRRGAGAHLPTRESGLRLRVQVANHRRKREGRKKRDPRLKSEVGTGGAAQKYLGERWSLPERHSRFAVWPVAGAVDARGPIWTTNSCRSSRPGTWHSEDDFFGKIHFSARSAFQQGASFLIGARRRDGAADASPLF